MTYLFREKNFALLDEAIRSLYSQDIIFSLNKNRIIALARLNNNYVSYQLITRRLNIKGEYLSSIIMSLAKEGVLERKSKNVWLLTEKFYGIPDVSNNVLQSVRVDRTPKFFGYIYDYEKED